MTLDSLCRDEECQKGSRADVWHSLIPNGTVEPDGHYTLQFLHLHTKLASPLLPESSLDSWQTSQK